MALPALTEVFLKIQAFWNISPCRLVNSWQSRSVLGPLDPEEEGTEIIGNVGSYSTADMMYWRWRTESKLIKLSPPHIKVSSLKSVVYGVENETENKSTRRSKEMTE